MGWHAVLKHWHPMVGIDFHIPVTPPALPSAPYKTFFILAGTWTVASYATSHNSQGFGVTMQQGTDIGPCILHLGPPSVTLPVEWLLSSSKSHFGSSAYPAEGKPVAVALAIFVNPNLNCGTPVPTPFGVVIAANTHLVNMSLADFLAGLASMAVDFALQSIFQWGTGKLLGAIVGRLGPQAMSRTAARQAARAVNRARAPGTPKVNIGDYARQLTGQRRALAEAWGRNAPRAMAAIGWLAGGPLGLAPEEFTGWSPGGAAANAANDAVRNHLNGGESVEEHPGGADADRDVEPSGD